MKRIILAVSALAVLTSAGVATAAPSNVFSTPHNMAMRGSNTGDVCIFCHASHNASKTSKAPLWNRTLPNGATYVLYSSPTAKNRIYKSGLTTSSPSLGCMSCHDGGTIGGRLINGPADVPSGTPVTATAIATGKTNFGSDLSNHHPVNFNIDDTVSGGEIQPKVMITMPGTGLPLYHTGRPVIGGEGSDLGMECSTCHNSHDQTYGKFLRKSAVGSALCITCHNK